MNININMEVLAEELEGENKKYCCLFWPPAIGTNLREDDVFRDPIYPHSKAGSYMKQFFLTLYLFKGGK